MVANVAKTTFKTKKMKTFKDIYELPFKLQIGIRVLDSKNQFAFQFLTFDDDMNGKILDIINGGKNNIKDSMTFVHKNGYITTDKGGSLILIRGWGNLTGVGGHNMPREDAMNVQDTLAEYIVEKLNNKNNIQ